MAVSALPRPLPHSDRKTPSQKGHEVPNISPDMFDRSGQTILHAAKVLQRELEETSSNLNKVNEVQMLAEESMRKLKRLEIECKQRSGALQEAEQGDIRRLQRLLGVVRQKAEVENRISSQLEDILSKNPQTTTEPT